MERATENKIVLVTRPTRLDDLIKRFNTLDQARFYVEHLGADFEDYLDEHRNYYGCLELVLAQLENLGRVQRLDRGFLPNFLFGTSDTVVVLGQDGLVANTLKYLNGQPVLGVNPDPGRWDGVLLPFDAQSLPAATMAVFNKEIRLRNVTMAKATLSDGQVLYGVNDLFIGQRSHVSARYEIALGARREHQSSSGVIVSTGLGSTGWFKSVLTGAAGVMAAVTGQTIKRQQPKEFDWDTPQLYFSVREPFPSKKSQAELVFGKITTAEPLTIVSEMPENGVIFSDGIEADFLKFGSGMKATIEVADRVGCLAC